MAALTGTAQAVPIGDGFEVRAPGIVGEARLVPPVSKAMRAPIQGFDARSRGIDQALAAARLTEVHQVELKVEGRTSAPRPARAMGPATPRDNLVEVTAPPPPPGKAQIVLARDHNGVLTWHLPTKRKGAGKQAFFVPAPLTPRPGAPAKGGPQRERGLIDVVGRKVLQFLVYPILDPVFGPIEAAFAERWEEKNRPYGLRTFTPINFREPVPMGLAPQGWRRLGEGRALLFIHGTFSTAHGAFAGIPDDVMRTLYDRYAKRVFAFNHFTLSHDPIRNAQWFLSQMPNDARVEADIVCHSRGGLVARALAERPSAFGIDTSRLVVKRVVFAGVPNAGTLLAQADHMVQMIDRLTTLVSLFPDGPVAETLEALVTAVKVIGHAGLKALPGLAAMDPAGGFLAKLNKPDAEDVPVGYAIAADFEPADAALKTLITDGIADTVMDRVFENVPNDLVVPQPGVFEGNGAHAFPIPVAHLLKIAPAAGVMHTTLFKHKPAQDKILEWLTKA